MVWPLIMCVLLRVRRRQHPELFDGHAALRSINACLEEYTR